MRSFLLFVLSLGLLSATSTLAQDGTTVIGPATAAGSPLVTNSVRTITASTSVATTDGSLYVSASAGSGITITLSAASIGQAVLINNLSSSSVTIAAGSGISIGTVPTSLASGQAVIVHYYAANKWSLVATPSGTGGSPTSLYAGSYSSGTSYASGVIVTYNGSPYLSIVSSNLGNTPSTSASYWEPLGGSSGTGSGTLSDGSGTTTPGLFPMSTTTSHVYDYNSGLSISSGQLQFSGAAGMALTGTLHGITIPAGSQVTGVVGSVIFGSDASLGYAEANEDAMGWSRICTAANYSSVCPAGGAVANTTTVTDTTAIDSNDCDAGHTVTMTGLTSAMTVNFTATTDTHTVVGWGSPSDGLLYITTYPATDTLTYFVCNATSSSITPGASVTWNVSAK